MSRFVIKYETRYIINYIIWYIMQYMTKNIVDYAWSIWNVEKSRVDYDSEIIGG